MSMSTIFLVMAEFQTCDIPLEDIAEKYFGYDKKKMLREANKQGFPFPVRRAGGQKSQWLVNANDLADWIDRGLAEAQEMHIALKQSA